MIYNAVPNIKMFRIDQFTFLSSAAEGIFPPQLLVVASISYVKSCCIVCVVIAGMSCIGMSDE